MADETLELKIEIDASQSISTLDKLNKELVKMKSDLKGLDKGSKAFNDLSKSIDKTEKEAKQLNSELKKNEKQVKSNKAGVSSFSDGIKNTLSQLGLMPASLGKATGAIGGLSTAAGTGTKAMKILKLAMASTGILLLVGAVASLISYFKSTEEGATKLKNIMAPIGILLGNIRDIAADFGEKIVAAFENPKQAISDLWDAIKSNIIVRFKSLLELFDLGGKIMVKTFKATGLALKGIFSDEAKEESKKLFKEIGQDAIEFGKTYVDALTGVEDSYDKLKDKAKELVDETKKESAEQIKLNNEALALEKRKRDFKVEEAQLEADISEARLKANDKENYTAQERKAAIEEALELNEKLAAEKERIAKEELRIMEVQASFSKSDEDTLNAIADKKAEIIRLEKSQNDQARALVMKQQTINAELEKEKDIREDFVLEVDTTAEDERFNYLQELEQKTTFMKEVELKKREETLEKYRAEGLVTDEEYAQEKLDIQAGYVDLEIQKQIEGIETEMVLNQEAYENKLISEAEYLDRLEELREEKRELTEINQKDFLNKLLTGEKLNAQERAEVAAAVFQTMASFLNALAGLRRANMEKELKLAEGNEKKQEAIRKKYAEKEKKAALLTAVVNVAAGVASALALTPPASYILAAITAALGAIEIATIAKAQYAQGGLLIGPSHAQGGIPTNLGEMEGGEAVINKTAMTNPSLRNLASSVNTATGGKDFSTGDGSIKLSPESISEIVNGYNNKKVIVSETDITETQNRVAVMEEYASI